MRLLLRQLYLDFRIPTDQYAKPQRKAELAAFVQPPDECVSPRQRA